MQILKEKKLHQLNIMAEHKATSAISKEHNDILVFLV
jgi:hypothetical protein